MNLLTQNHISIRSITGERHRLSLAALLVEMSNDRVADFPLLRPHQVPAWHIFLVQLATLALLEIADGATAPETAEQWVAALRRLTPAFPDDEPWCLAVDDWTRPAFLQAPVVSESDRTDFKRTYSSPDALDVLLTGRNHDVKGSRMKSASPEEWLYALLTLQTTEGFLGQGNYGIARMNGGFASRPMLRCTPRLLGLGGQVFRDVYTLLEKQDQLTHRAQELRIGIREPVQRLLWLSPWNGAASLTLEHFHPLCIEVCRRVRLRQVGEALSAVSAGSRVARVDASGANGVVADPWIPIKLDGNKSFTVTSRGLGYRQIVELLDPKHYARPLLAQPTKAEQRSGAALMLRATALARGQGKTEGFHDRVVELPPSTATRFSAADTQFSDRAARFVQMAGDVAGKAVRPALIQLVQGKEDLDWKKPSNEALTDPWLKTFDARVDQFFFPALAATFEDAMDDEAAELVFSQTLVSHANAVFAQAADASPRSDQLRVIAKARAELMLDRGLRKQLPLIAITQEALDDAR